MIASSNSSTTEVYLSINARIGSRGYRKSGSGSSSESNHAYIRAFEHRQGAGCEKPVQSLADPSFRMAGMDLKEVFCALDFNIPMFESEKPSSPNWGRRIFPTGWMP